MDDFFSHENQATPPSLSSIGNKGTKSDLLKCFDLHEKATSPNVEVKVFDGAPIVNILKPTACRTFHEYVDLIFLPWIEKELSSVRRLD